MADLFVTSISLVAPGVNPSTVKDDDPRLMDLNPSLDLRIRNKSKEVFVEEELARRR
jgi:DnaJ family protein C protein 8